MDERTRARFLVRMFRTRRPSIPSIARRLASGFAAPLGFASLAAGRFSVSGTVLP